jgi:potassium-transporting ATPase KdpC subunit
MMNHLRGNLLLLVFTVVICCVLYPLSLFVVGKGLFPSATSGSLVNAKGESTSEAARGSKLIAQPFTSEEYFWPRPSAVSYNATASGGTNWGSNNPKLRDRAAQQLGPMVVYKNGSRSAGTGAEPKTPQQDIEAWFGAVTYRVASWASDTSIAPANLAKTDLSGDKYGLQGEYILQWAKDHPEVLKEWKEANSDKTDDPKPEDLVGLFFASFAKVHPRKWPGVVEVKLADGKTEKKIEPVTSDPAIHANFFDLWLSDPANKDKVADIETVPVDMVTASGSGLDPHITLRNAMSVYQLDRVAGKRAKSTPEVAKVKQAISDLLKEKSFTPLSGLIGEPLINVLEMNIELDMQFPLNEPRTK